MYLKIISTLLTLLLVISCSSTGEPLNERTVDNLSASVRMSTKAITATHLRYYSPRGISEEDQKNLEAGFRRFMKLYKRVRPEYRDIPAVKTFLVNYLNRIGTYEEKKAYRTYTAESPLAVAASFIFATGIDLNTIDDKSVMQNGMDLLSLTEDEMNHGIYYLLQHTQEQLFRQLNRNIFYELHHKRDMEPADFMQNILHPVGTLLSSGVGIDDVNIEKLSQAFNNIFDCKGTPLKAFILEFLTYLGGGTMQVAVQNELNEILVEKGYYFDIDRNYCGVFSVEKKLVIDHPSLNSVNILKELDLSRRKLRFGDAVYRESVVNVYQNSVEKEVGKILKIVNGSFEDSTLIERMGLWQVSGVYPADSLYHMIYKRDFSGKDSLTIYENLILEVAVHEAKHAWDTQFDTTSRKRRAFDAEVSAHLTESALSGTPHYSLMMCLHRFHSHLGYYELRQPIYTLNNQVWTLVEKSISKMITEDELRSGIRDIYSSYRDREDLLFPSLEEFEESVGSKITSF